MQKDLDGLAFYLSSAKSPYDIPKTIVFAATRNSLPLLCYAVRYVHVGSMSECFMCLWLRSRRLHV